MRRIGLLLLLVIFYQDVSSEVDFFLRIVRSVWKLYPRVEYSKQFDYKKYKPVEGTIDKILEELGGRLDENRKGVLKEKLYKKFKGREEELFHLSYEKIRGEIYKYLENYKENV